MGNLREQPSDTEVKNEVTKRKTYMGTSSKLNPRTFKSGVELSNNLEMSMHAVIDK